MRSLLDICIRREVRYVDLPATFELFKERLGTTVFLRSHEPWTERLDNLIGVCSIDAFTRLIGMSKDKKRFDFDLDKRMLSAAELRAVVDEVDICIDHGLLANEFLVNFLGKAHSKEKAETKKEAGEGAQAGRVLYVMTPGGDWRKFMDAYPSFEAFDPDGLKNAYWRQMPNSNAITVNWTKIYILDDDFTREELPKKVFSSYYSFDRILSLAGEYKYKHHVSPKTQYMHISITDTDGIVAAIQPHLERMCAFVDDGVNARESNLVIHCAGGVSRSATFLLYYLLTRHADAYPTLESAFNAVFSVRRCINPKYEVLLWLKSLEKEKTTVLKNILKDKWPFSEKLVFDVQRAKVAVNNHLRKLVDDEKSGMLAAHLARCSTPRAAAAADCDNDEDIDGQIFGAFPAKNEYLRTSFVRHLTLSEMYDMRTTNYWSSELALSIERGRVCMVVYQNKLFLRVTEGVNPSFAVFKGLDSEYAPSNLRTVMDGAEGAKAPYGTVTVTVDSGSRSDIVVEEQPNYIAILGTHAGGYDYSNFSNRSLTLFTVALKNSDPAKGLPDVFSASRMHKAGRCKEPVQFDAALQAFVFTYKN